MSISSSLRSQYELVIGLEVHAQLLTASKAYSSDANEYGNLPNTNISEVTIAHPGALPVHNEKVIEYAIKMGLATECSITRFNYYDRKNYFYPDLPKGYQITQDKTPICTKGRLEIKVNKDAEPRVIGITRIHMEEDAGKSMHYPGEEESLIDLNRAGVPLIEIVSEPDLRTSEEAYAYLSEIKRLLMYLEVCDGNMEEGSLRCDANISVRKPGAPYGKRVEVKNMNSFRNVMRAIEFERDRHIELIEAGGEVQSETRMFDATTGETYSLRTKESLNDYRYFPEPDLQPFVVSETYLSAIEAEMPALPQQLARKFTQEYKLSEYDTNILIEQKGIALYFEELCTYTKAYKAACNWIIGPVKSYLNELTLDIEAFPISTQRLAGLVDLVESGKVSFTAASQKIFSQMLSNEEEALVIAQRDNLIQDTDENAIAEMVDAVIAKFPEKVQEYKKGKTGLLGMFVGEVMKLAKGKADPKIVNQYLSKALQG